MLAGEKKASFPWTAEGRGAVFACVVKLEKE
jgi:hypothetical protein